jgi:hypothetical protein
VLLGTVAGSGFPRISPIEPVFGNGELYLGMGSGTQKGADMYRDAHILVHNTVTRRYGDEGEVKVRGLAVALDGTEERRLFEELIEATFGWRPTEPYDVFGVDVQSVAFVRYDPRNGHKQRVERWPT